MNRFFIALSLVAVSMGASAQNAEAEKPLDEVFRAADLTPEWSDTFKVLDDEKILKDAGRATDVSSAFQKIASYKGDVTAIRGLVPGLIRAVGNAGTPAQRSEAAAILRKIFLADKLTDDYDRRIAKELVKLLQNEKDAGVKSKILDALARTGDAWSVQAFNQALENKPDAALLTSIEIYLSRIGFNGGPIPLPGFLKLAKLLRGLPEGQGLATSADILIRRDNETRKASIKDLNRKLPTFTPNHKNK